MKKITREEALAYHTGKRHGKLAVVATKPCVTQRDLSLAYTPGVAEPCLEIARDPDLVYEYTNKGNLVAVVSNGTAVLGLGNIGPAAVPITLAAVADELSPGDSVLCMGIGSGLNAGVIEIQW